MSFLSDIYKENRVNTADLLKGIAVILMIQVHLTEIYATKEIYESTYGRISLFLGGPPAAPLFMLIMGWFIVYKSRTSSQLLVRGLKLLGGGILLNIGLNFNLIISIFTGGYFYYLDPWRYIFGADILPLAGLSLIIFSLLHKIFRRVYILYFLAAVAVVSIQPFMPSFGSPEYPWLYYVQAFLWGNIEWSYFPLIPWLAYPLTGAGFYYLYSSFSYRNEKIKILYLILWAVFILFTIKYGIDTASNLKVYYHHDIFYYLWTLAFLSGFILLINMLNKRAGNNAVVKYVKWLGQNVTAAYVFQWILIGNIAPVVYKSQELEDILFWFFGILGMVTVLILIFRYNKLKKNKPQNKLRFVQ